MLKKYFFLFLLSAVVSINSTAQCPSTVEAGDDIDMCVSDASNGVHLHATYSDVNILWHGGEGQFFEETSAYADYLPTPDEVANGSVTLYATTSGICDSISDTIQVFFNPQPSLTVEVLNPSPCWGDTLMLQINDLINVKTCEIVPMSGYGMMEREGDVFYYYPDIFDYEFGAEEYEFHVMAEGEGCDIYYDEFFTTPVQPAPVGIGIGPDLSTCSNQFPVAIYEQLNFNNSASYWMTSGSGSFSVDDTTEFEKIIHYTPSEEDTSLDEIVLSYSSDTTSCGFYYDELVLTFNDYEANVAGDRVSCSENIQDLTVDVNTPNGVGRWFSSGNGEFYPNNRYPNYYASTTEDIENGVTITFTSDTLYCGSYASDSFDVSYTFPSITDISGSQWQCDGEPLALNAQYVHADSVVWSNSGSGQFLPNQFASEVSYEPSPSDLQNGFVDVTFLAYTKSCQVGVDSTVRHYFNQGGELVNILIDSLYTTCDPIVPLPIEVDSNYTGSWSSTGNGEFRLMEFGAQGYYLSEEDKERDHLTLTFTTTPGPCGFIVSDQVEVFTAGQNTLTVDAGEDFVVCDEDEFVLEGTVLETSIYSWQILQGDGVLEYEDSLNTKYTAHENDHVVRFLLYAEPEHNCPGDVSDTIDVTLKQTPEIFAQDQYTCSDSILTIQANITGDASFNWLGGEGIFFSYRSESYNQYQFSAAEKEVGFVELFPTAENECGTTKDTITLRHADYLSPILAIDSFVCYKDTMSLEVVSLDSSVTHFSWDIYASGNTYTSDSDSTGYVPTSSDFFNGYVEVYFASFGCMAETFYGRIPLNKNSFPLNDEETTCSQIDTITLQSPKSGSFSWLTIEGNGEILPGNSSNTIDYVVTEDDKIRGYSLIGMDASGNGSCGTIVDTFRVEYINPVLDLPNDTVLCSFDPITFNFETNVRANLEIYALNTNTSTLVETGSQLIYTPGIDDRYQGSGGIVFHPIDICGVNPDTVNINYNDTPEIELSSTDVGCQPEVALEAIITDGSNVHWFSNGSGTFSTNNQLETSYSLSEEDANKNTIIFFATTDTTTCGFGIDTTWFDLAKEKIDLGENVVTCDTLVYLPEHMENGVAWHSLNSSITPSIDTLSRHYLNFSPQDSTDVYLTLLPVDTNICKAYLTSDTIVISKINGGVNINPIEGVVCRESGINLSSSIQGVDFYWLGEGEFLPSNNVTAPIYIPSELEKENGEVEIVLTSDSTNGCGIFRDTIIVELLGPVVEAGENVPLDIDGVQLSGTTTEVNEIVDIYWYGGEGTFSPINNLSTIYYPEPSESGDTVHLYLNVVSEIEDSLCNGLDVITLIPQQPRCPVTLGMRRLNEGNGYEFIAEPSSPGIINWDFGDGTFSDELRAFHEYEEPGNYIYTLTYMAFDSSCTSLLRDTVVVEPEPEDYYFVNGRISAGDELIDTMLVTLYKHDGNVFELDTTVFLAGLDSGYFNIHHIEKGYYSLKALIPPGSVLRDDFLSTYFGGGVVWSTENAFLIDDDYNNLDIDLVEIISNDETWNTGNDSIVGTVNLNQPTAKTNSTGAIEQAVVFLHDANGKVLTSTPTDENGDYMFVGISQGTYQVSIDYPGTSQAPISLTVDGDNSTKEEVNVGLTKETIVLSINQEADLKRIVFFPNPVEDKLYINEEHISWELYALDGTLKAQGNGHEIDMEDVTSGVYLIKYEHEGRVSVAKIVKQ